MRTIVAGGGRLIVRGVQVLGVYSRSQSLGRRIMLW